MTFVNSSFSQPMLQRLFECAVFEGSRPVPDSPQSTELTPAMLEAIVDATRQLFPGEISIEVESDPEWPEEKYIVFGVVAQGSVTSIVDRHCRWLEMIAQLAPGFRNARLFIDPRS